MAAHTLPVDDRTRAPRYPFENLNFVK